MDTKFYFSVLLTVLMTCHTYDISMRIDTNKVHTTVNPKFINVAIPIDATKHKWENIQKKYISTRVKTLATELAPSFLRLGGFTSDHCIFQNDKLPYDRWREGKTIQRIERKMKREMDTCDKRMESIVITASFYDEIHKFVSSVGWDLIFGLNLLLRKPDGAWDPSNAEELMKYTVQSGYKMGGWELGNEPNNYGRKFGCKVGARQLVKDFHTLNSLLGEYPQFDDTEVLGPSVTQLSTDNYFQRFINAGGGEVVTALTYHQYYEDGSAAKLEDFYNPHILNILYRQIQKGVNLTRAAGTKAKLWLGETSSAWRSGAPGLSDRYVAAFMWLDKLGMSARDGFNAVVRQSFYGGNYSLLDNESCAPNPDYWLTVLFKLLVGNKVLRVISPDNLGKIRAYAHCTETRKSSYPEGSVTVYVMNIDQSPVTIELPDFARNSPLHVYNMLPADDDLLSKFVLLNGKKLQMEDDKAIPNLLRPVKTTSTVLIPALSYSFIVVPDARLHLCM